MRRCLQTQPVQRPTFNDIVQRLHVIQDATPPTSFFESSTPGVMSLSEFEAAVGGESAARHAYLDALQAALPACEDGKTRAIDESDFDEAAIFSAIAKSIRAILSGIEKPVSKADIRASLDGGIFEAPHREWQREKSGIERDKILILARHPLISNAVCNRLQMSLRAGLLSFWMKKRRPPAKKTLRLRSNSRKSERSQSVTVNKP